ncbi:MAG: hypothetical protein ACXABY_00725 [Candidatus Thorarchaeota archaeon]|jgi:hypothetical protein
MGVEELKLIMDALQGLGIEARSAFYFWICYRVFVDLLVASVFVFCGLGISRIVPRLINITSRAGRFEREVARIFSELTGRKLDYRFDGDMYAGDRETLTVAVRSALEEKFKSSRAHNLAR